MCPEAPGRRPGATRRTAARCGSSPATGWRGQGSVGSWPEGGLRRWRGAACARCRAGPTARVRKVLVEHVGYVAAAVLGPGRARGRPLAERRRRCGRRRVVTAMPALAVHTNCSSPTRNGWRPATASSALVSSPRRRRRTRRPRVGRRCPVAESPARRADRRVSSRMARRRRPRAGTRRLPKRRSAFTSAVPSATRRCKFRSLLVSAGVAHRRCSSRLHAGSAAGS